MFKEFYVFDELDGLAQEEAKGELEAEIRRLIREVMMGVKKPIELERLLLSDLRMADLVYDWLYEVDGSLIKERERLTVEEWRTGLIEAEEGMDPALLN